ncbi:MAG: putative short-chain dehydrogenase [Vampirovibrio sp.]|nr:putative short-chain dehydrogenase [Vampirovibrio sp.]
MTAPRQPHRLSGQVAIITGASQGIGEAIAHHLARLGLHLVLCARNTQKLAQLADRLRQEAPDSKTLTLACDVRKHEQVQAVVEETRKAFGRIDVLINNAGVAPHTGLMQEISIEDIDRTIDTNLKGSIYFMKVAGKTAYPFWSIYDASKFGLHAVTEAVAEEQRTNNIKVIGIYPGAVDTSIWDDIHWDQEPKREGMLRADDVAESVAFILQQPPKVFIKEFEISPLQPTV